MDASLFKKYTQPQKTKTSERGLLLEDLLKEINNERAGTKYKPTTIKLLAIRLAHIPTQDLYYLKSIALDSKRRGGSFSKTVYGSIKVKNDTTM